MGGAIIILWRSKTWQVAGDSVQLDERDFEMRLPSEKLFEDRFTIAKIGLPLQGSR